MFGGWSMATENKVLFLTDFF
jgi:hypothetical protein